MYWIFAFLSWSIQGSRLKRMNENSQNPLRPSTDTYLKAQLTLGHYILLDIVEHMSSQICLPCILILQSALLFLDFISFVCLSYSRSRGGVEDFNILLIQCRTCSRLGSMVLRDILHLLNCSSGCETGPTLGLGM